MDVKCAPLAYGRVGADMTLMFCDYGISSGQTKPAPGLLCGEVRIENPRENFWRDAAAIVSNEDPDVLAGIDGQRTIFDDHVFRTHFNHTALRRCLPGINQQVVEGLTNLSGIDLGRPQIVGGCQVEPDL